MAVHNRHIGIEQYQVRFFGLRFVQALFPIWGGNNIKVGPLEPTLYRADQVRLIIDEEYLRPGGSSLGFKQAQHLSLPSKFCLRKNLGFYRPFSQLILAEIGCIYNIAKNF
jgi:hypothetical protein